MSVSESPVQREWAHYTEPLYIDVDGLRTAYRRRGAGVPVVYLHGGELTRLWLPFVEELANVHDVVAPEHPGFGDTPAPDTLEDFSDYILHYDALLDALELEDVHLVGHSLGGWIAAELAVFYPRRFRSLTLITPTGLRVADRIASPGLNSFRLDPSEKLDVLLNGRGERYQEFFVQEGAPGDVVQAFAENTTRAKLSWNPRYDRRLDHRLPRIKAASLVIAAEEDRLATDAVSKAYARLIPAARRVVVPGPDGERSAHLVQLEQPTEVAELVAEHIAANV